MRKQGIRGALLFDAGEAASVARGPAFMSTEWRELFKPAVREANRCGIVLTVNLCSGWNAGGPWVTPDHAAKKLVYAQSVANGGSVKAEGNTLVVAAADVVILLVAAATDDRGLAGRQSSDPLAGAARPARRSCNCSTKTAVASVPIATVGSPRSSLQSVSRLTKSRPAMSAVEIPRLRRASARSRPSLRRAWAAGKGMLGADDIGALSGMADVMSHKVSHIGR